MKLSEINENNQETINEARFGIDKFTKYVATGLKNLFKSSDTKVLDFVSSEVSKSVSGLVRSNTKQVSMSAIKATPGYKKSLTALVEHLSLKTFKKPYAQLVQKEKDQILKEASVGLNNTIVAELKNASKTLVSKVDNLGGARLIKMGQKTSQITKTIANINKTKLTKASTLIKQNAKLVGEGKAGAALLSRVKGGKVNIIKNGQIFSASTNSLGKSNIKVFKLNSNIWKTLAAIGIGGGVILYLLGQLYPNDAVAVVDENENDKTNDDKVNPTTDWGVCLDNAISRKQAKIVVNKDSSYAVETKPTDLYPKGLIFYNNGRVLNIATSEMGSWTCKGGKPQVNNENINDIVGRVLREKLINEQLDRTLIDDVKKMIDYLDVPVLQSSVIAAHDLLERYANNGKGKKFLELYAKSGNFMNLLPDEDLRTSIDRLMLSNPLMVEYEKMIYALIDKIEDGKVTETQPKNDAGRDTSFNEQEIGEQEIDIVWDSQKKGTPKKDGGNAGGDGKTSTKKKFKSQFHDCEGKDFPLEFGCKSTKIAEVQKCLGVTADGKFGRFTKKAMEDFTHDTSKGLTKDIYDNIINNCGGKRNDVEPVLQSGGLKMSDLVKNNGGAKLDDTKLLNIIKNNQQPEELYKSLASNGYIVGDVRSTTLEDGTIIPSTNRVKYKGPDLSEDLLGMLDSFISTMGYDRIKQKTKGYGEKYVWLKK